MTNQGDPHADDSAASNEGEKDRIAGWKIAVFSGLLGLVGALVGGLFSYLLAVHSSNAQIAEDRNNFERQQQQAAYGKLLADAVPYDESVNHCDNLSTREPNQSAVYTTLYGDIASLEIVASTAGLRDAGNLATAVARLGYLCNELYKAGPNSPSGAQLSPPALAHLREEYLAEKRFVIHLQASLLADGRLDVGGH